MQEEAVDETPATEDCGCPSDFQETAGFAAGMSSFLGLGLRVLGPIML